MKTIKSKKANGFTLIELLLGLTIIGISIIAIVGISQGAANSSKIQTEVKNLQVISRSLRTSYSGEGSYSSLNDSIALAAGAFPTQMTAGGVIRSSWGTVVSVGPNANPGFFDITYSSIDTKSCTNLVPQVLTEFPTIKIQTTSNPSVTWTSALIATACSVSNSNTIVFTAR